MSKLNQSKVKWIINKKKEGKKNNKEIAGECEITPRRVQQLYSQYRQTGVMPMLKKERRPKRFLTEEEKAMIEESYQKMLFGANRLKPYIRFHCNKNINHNQIHRYLLKKGYAKERFVEIVNQEEVLKKLKEKIG